MHLCRRGEHGVNVHHHIVAVDPDILTPGKAAVGHETARCHASQPHAPRSRGAQTLTGKTAMTRQIPIAGHAAS